MEMENAMWRPLTGKAERRRNEVPTEHVLLLALDCLPEDLLVGHL